MLSTGSIFIGETFSIARFETFARDNEFQSIEFTSLDLLIDTLKFNFDVGLDKKW